MNTHYIAVRKATVKANHKHEKMEFPWSLMKPQDFNGMEDITKEELNDPKFRLDFANAFPSDEVRVYSTSELSYAMPNLGRVKLLWTKQKVEDNSPDARFPFKFITKHATTVDQVLAWS